MVIGITLIAALYILTCIGAWKQLQRSEEQRTFWKDRYYREYDENITEGFKRTSMWNERERDLVRLNLVPDKYLLPYPKVNQGPLDWYRIEEDVKDLQAYRAAVRGQEIAND